MNEDFKVQHDKKKKRVIIKYKIGEENHRFIVPADDRRYEAMEIFRARYATQMKAHIEAQQKSISEEI